MIDKVEKWHQLLLLLVLFIVAPPAYAEEMQLQFVGAVPSKGQVKVAIYRVAIGADWQKNAYRYGLTKNISAQGEVNIPIKNLPFGQYAIKGFQDINNNDTLDLNGSGFPLEPFAFSKASIEKKPVLALKDAIIDFKENKQVVTLQFSQLKK